MPIPREGASKVESESGRRTDPGKGARMTTRDCGEEGKKNGGSWFGSGEDCSSQRRASLRAVRPAKPRGAMIAKIPPALASHIARGRSSTAT